MVKGREHAVMPFMPLCRSMFDIRYSRRCATPASRTTSPTVRRTTRSSARAIPPSCFEPWRTGRRVNAWRGTAVPATVRPRLGLAAHFQCVVATDASALQLAHAVRHPGVHYGRSLETQSSLATAAVDLVTAAQALHWFEVEAFFGEVRRVLRPGGVVAVWCYDLARVDPAIDAVIDRFARETVGPHWAPERRHVQAGYRDLPFPFEELAFPGCTMEGELRLDQLAGYLGTWSAVRRYREAVGADPLPSLVAAITPLWGDAKAPRLLRWPLRGRVGVRS